MLNEVLRFIILLPFVILIGWGTSVAVQRFTDTTLSRPQRILVAAAVTAVLLYVFRKPPGRTAAMADISSSSLCLWIFG